MARQLSTSISDAILAYVSLNAAYGTMRFSISASIGFLIIGIAAGFGTLKFGLDNPHLELVSYHKFMSWLGSAVAMPYLAAGYHRLENSMFLSNVHLVSGFALLLLQNILSEKVKETATEAISSCAVVSIFLLSSFQSNAPGIVGAVCYIVAGLVIKTDGSWFGIPRVDIFHYMLVIANFALMQGLQQMPEPVYYKPPIRE